MQASHSDTEHTGAENKGVCILCGAPCQSGLCPACERGTDVTEADLADPSSQPTKRP